MRFMSWLGFSLTMLCSAAQADMLGVRLGVETWRAQPDIRAGDTGSAGALTFENASGLAWSGRLEHPLPLLPNIAARYQRLNLSGQTQLRAPLTLGQVSYTAGLETRQNYGMHYYDLTAYYEISDSDLFSVDVGVTARKVQAKINLNSMSTESGADLSVIIPMLYADTEVGVWGTDTAIFVTGVYSRYQSDINYDWRAGLSWRVIDIAMFQLYARAGWQQSRLVVTNRDHLDVVADNAGGFAAIYFDF